MRSKHSIRDLLHQFEIPDLATWWKKVEKEIGNKGLSLTIEPDLDIPPLINPKTPQGPIIWNAQQDWKIVEAVDSNFFRNRKAEIDFAIDEIILRISTEADIRRCEGQNPPCSVSIRIPAHLVNEVMSLSVFSGSFIQIDHLTSKLHDTLMASSPAFHWRCARAAATGLTPSQRLTSLAECILLHLEEDPAHTQYWRIFVEISDDFFTQIAELRALKIVLLNIWKTFKLPLEEHPQIYAIIQANKQQDLYSNLIRSTSMALSAVIGGIDSLCFEADPSTLLLSNDSIEYRRLSRNIHYILKHEAHLNYRLDPLYGSLHIEALTDALATKTWLNLGGKDPRRASNNY